MTDWQYASAILEPDGTLWDIYPDEGYAGGMAEAVRHASEWNGCNPDSYQACVVVRREAPKEPTGWAVVVNPGPAALPGTDKEN